MEFWQIVEWWTVAGFLIVITVLLSIRSAQRGVDAGDITAVLFVVIPCCLMWPFTIRIVILLAGFVAVIITPIWLIYWLVSQVKQKG